MARLRHQALALAICPLAFLLLVADCASPGEVASLPTGSRLYLLVQYA